MNVFHKRPGRLSYAGLVKLALDAAGSFTLAPGQTLSHVVAAHNAAYPNNKITVQQLVQANGGLDPTRYVAGKRYRMPAAPPVAAAAWQPSRKAFEYTVNKGDSLSSIASKTGVGLGRLQAANPRVADPYALQIGMKLQIPLSDRDNFRQAHGFFHDEFTPLSEGARNAIYMTESSNGKFMDNPDSSARGWGHMLEGTFNDVRSWYPDLAKYRHADLNDRKVSDLFMNRYFQHEVPAFQMSVGRRATEDDMIQMWNQGRGGVGSAAAKQYLKTVKGHMATAMGKKGAVQYKTAVDRLAEALSAISLDKNYGASELERGAYVDLAAKYRLKSADALTRVPANIMNGVGQKGQVWQKWLADRMFPESILAAAIHDSQYFIGGNESDRENADDALLDNLRTLAKENYPIVKVHWEPGDALSIRKILDNSRKHITNAKNRARRTVLPRFGYDMVRLFGGSKFNYAGGGPRAPRAPAASIS